MTRLRRAFLAVVPPPTVVRWTESLHQADADLRWSRPEQRHVTVRFLGEVADLDRRNESFAESFRRCSPFTMSLGGGGAFAEARRASVLWLGVRQGRAALGELAAAVAEPADRPYVAHLTLARATKPRDVTAAVAALDACGESESWIVDDVVLFDSHDQADGTHHTEVARFTLAG